MSVYDPDGNAWSIANPEPEELDAMALLDQQQAKMPLPVFGCAVEDCAAEVSYPSNMLFWSEGDGDAGFFCMACLNGLGLSAGQSLESVQKRVGWFPTERLKE